MNKIFYIMGKSSSGKDTIFQKIVRNFPNLKSITLYTTRPARVGEEEGVGYHFIDNEKMKGIFESGKIVESRTYMTIHGEWIYATVDDGRINLPIDSYLTIGTLESYEQVQLYYGAESVIPIYIEVEDGIRLKRALEREQNGHGNYAELCRRFLADEEDFSKGELERLQIKKVFLNENIETCVREISLYIEERV